MKKKLCILPVLVLAINVYSQQEMSVKFGVKAGVAFASLKQDYADNSISSNLVMKPGLIFGGFVNIPIDKSMFFQPSLLYVRKGAYEKFQSSRIPIQYNYYELPMDLLYKFKKKPASYFLGGGISPALRSNFLGSYGIKQFDLGFNILTGYLTPTGFSINLGYTYGLLNLSSNKSYISKIQNKYFSLTAGYEF
jgi:hypothetical protein